VVELSETFDLLRVLATGRLAAAVVQTGRIILERVRGRNRIAEIEAERDAEIAKIEAAGKVEIAKRQVELQLVS
jgi:formylmethanofuran dehydrogenase subunit E